MLAGEAEPTILKQKTDTHWRSENGEGHFNWRMVYSDLQLPQPASSPCRLSLDVWDEDPLRLGKELVGSVELDVRSMLFRKALHRNHDAVKKGQLAARIAKMTAVELRRELRQLGQPVRDRDTLGELATQLKFHIDDQGAGEYLLPAKPAPVVATPPKRCACAWHCWQWWMNWSGCCAGEPPKPRRSMWLDLREEPNANPQLVVRCSPFEGSPAVWCAGLSRALFFRTQRSWACVARLASCIRSQRCGHCSARDGTPHRPRPRNASALG